MIDIVMKKVFEHNTKLETMIKQIDKKNLQILSLFVTVYAMWKIIKKHDKQINDIKNELKEIKSKGE